MISHQVLSSVPAQNVLQAVLASVKRHLKRTSYHCSLRRSMKDSGAPSMLSMRQFSYTGPLAQKLATSFRRRSAASSAVRRCFPAAAVEAAAPPGCQGCIPSCASSNRLHSCSISRVMSCQDIVGYEAVVMVTRVSPGKDVG